MTASPVNLVRHVLDNMASCFFAVSAGNEELHGGGRVFLFLSPPPPPLTRERCFALEQDAWYHEFFTLFCRLCI